MADQPDRPTKSARAAPPPFIGPPRTGALAPRTHTDRATLPPFSPPFVKRPSPVVRGTPVEESTPASPSSPDSPAAATSPAWLDAAPNEHAAPSAAAEVGIEWVNPDQPAVVAPPQAATGIEWLDSPAPVEPPAAATRPASSADDDDPFGWDPAEERVGALDTAPTSGSLESLKELEPWASPGAEPPASSVDDVASALERIAARVRSGDLFVPSALTAASEEAVLAAVLAALLQRARG